MPPAYIWAVLGVLEDIGGVLGGYWGYWVPFQEIRSGPFQESVPFRSKKSVPFHNPMWKTVPFRSLYIPETIKNQKDLTISAENNNFCEFYEKGHSFPERGCHFCDFCENDARFQKDGKLHISYGHRKMFLAE